MSSLYEKYKYENNLKSVNDLEELRRLYNNNPTYKKEFGFAEFIDIATKNSSEPLSAEIKNIVSPEIKPDPLEADPNFYKKQFEPTYQDWIGDNMPLKNYRKTVGGIANELFTGGAKLVSEAALKLNTYGQRETLEKIAKDKNISYSELVNQIEKDSNKRIDKGSATLLRPVVGADIYDGDTIQQPEGIIGTGAVTIAPFVSVFRRARNLFGTRADDALKRTGKKADTKKLLTAKKIELGKDLAAAEISSQVLFADDPEVFMVAKYINENIENTVLDDSFVGDFFEYLDADENSSSTQRRLTLLLDGAVFTGIIGGGLKTVSLTKDKLAEVLKRIKSNSELKEGFKRMLAPLKEKLEPFTPNKIKDKVDDDVFVDIPLEGRGIKREATRILNGVRKLRRKYFTSRGYYNSEMHNIILDGELAKAGFEKQAKNLLDDLTYQSKQLVKEGEFNGSQVTKMLEDYLSGNIKLKELPEGLQSVALRTRDTIDDLSNLLLEQKNIPEDLKFVIRSNIGKYLRRSYEYFENPSYKPSQDVIDGAVESIAEKLAGRSIQTSLFDDTAKLSIDKYKDEAKEIVEGLLGDRKNMDFYLDKVYGFKKADILFQTRKEIDEPLRKFFGQRETEDIGKTVFTTIETLGKYLSDAKMYDDLYTKGKGKWFFEETTDAVTRTRTSGVIQGKQFGALDGMRTTKQIAKFFEKTSTGTFERLLSPLLAVKGVGQAVATVYSFTTHARNTIGGGIIMAQNGLNPFSKETRDSFKTLTNELYARTPNKNKALEDLYIKYQNLGIVNQNVRIGEFKKLINENITDANWVKKLDRAFAGQAYGGAKKLFNKVTDTFNKTYVAEDDIWRIASFQKELNVLKKAFPNRSIDELEREAATIIRNTFPTYNLVPLGARELRKVPVFGNFYSFFAERWRNNYHTLMRGMEEIRSGNPDLIERGYQRLASQMAVGYLGSEGVNRFTKHAFGVSDEEEQAIKDLALPPWSNNGTIGYKRDKFGNISFVDLTFSDPNAPVLNVFNAFTNEIFDPESSLDSIDNKIANASMESLKTFLAPFTDQPLFTDRLGRALLLGEDENGNPIEGTNPQQSGMQNFLATSKYVGEVLLPRFLKEGAEYTRELQEGELSGEEFVEEFVGKLTGLNYTSVNTENLKTNLFFKVKDFNTNYKDTKDLLNEYKVETIEEALENYLIANRAYYRDYVTLNRAIRGARILGIRNDDIKEAIKKVSGEGLGVVEKNGLSSYDNNFQPIRLTEKELINLYNSAAYTGVSFNEFKSSYKKLYNQLSILPLLQYEDDLNEKEKEVIKILKKPKKFTRQQKVEGGLVSGPEVSDTKEDPADRVDPFTGAPYSDQMARLGFNRGSIVDIQKVGNKSVKTYEDGSTEEIEIPEEIRNEPGLRMVAPIVELLGGVGILKGGKVVKEVGEEVLEKRAVPKILYHGSGERGLKEIIPSYRRTKTPNPALQRGVFTNPSIDNVVKFTGEKGSIYGLDVSDISSFKNLLSISRNKVLNADKPNKSLLKALDKEIKDFKTTKKTGLLQQGEISKSKQLRQFKDDMLNKDNYITGITPAVDDFLKRQKVDVVKTTPNFRNPDRVPNFILLRDSVPVKDEFLTKLKNNKYYIQKD